VAGSLFAQQLSITSFQRNGLLTWTNPPGTNAFAVQWTPSLTSSWFNAAPPLDSIITTNSQTTVSVAIVPPTSFYRVVEGFGPQALRGTWILIIAIATNPGNNASTIYFTADGNGVLTNAAIFNPQSPPGFYSISNAGSMTLTFAANETDSVTGRFVDANDVSFTGFGTAMRVQDVSLCAGNWSGTLSETNDPNGLASYSVALTVTTNGSVSFSGSLGTGSGLMFALAPTNGASSAFIKTGLNSSNPYNQIQLIGTLSGNTITGSFNTDSGTGANAILGTVTLTR